jgi:hypothetical protein
MDKLMMNNRPSGFEIDRNTAAINDNEPSRTSSYPPFRPQLWNVA